MNVHPMRNRVLGSCERRRYKPFLFWQANKSLHISRFTVYIFDLSLNLTAQRA